MGLKYHENSSQLHVLLLWSVNSSGDEILLRISIGRSNFCIKSSNGVALPYVEGARVIHGSGVLRPCSRKREDYIGLRVHVRAGTGAQELLDRPLNCFC